MFQALFNKAERAIEQTIGQMIARAVTAVPFVIAVGFGTAALWLKLDREYGAESASLVMAAGFLSIGLAAAIWNAVRAPAPLAEPAAPASEATAGQGEAKQEAARGLGDADRELLMAALTTAAPVALPQLLRMLLRNLPLVAAIAAAVFVMSRPSPGASHTAAAE